MNGGPIAKKAGRLLLGAVLAAIVGTGLMIPVLAAFGAFSVQTDAGPAADAPPMAGVASAGPQGSIAVFVTVAGTDTDGDGFTDQQEAFMGTDPAMACAATPTRNDEHPDAWPPDADDDQDADIGDVIRLFGDPDKNGLNVILTPSEYTPRSDFDGDGDVDIGDLIAAFGDGRILTSCV